MASAVLLGLQWLQPVPFSMLDSPQLGQNIPEEFWHLRIDAKLAVTCASFSLKIVLSYYPINRSTYFNVFIESPCGKPCLSDSLYK
ncbi:hypothetical protein CEXT_221421 [Caerostris extrusa]|uniref:Uncharacterized protein n=1 Tax=Caerostris extrusa TaxID=172846 RepID=A0AAV4Y614_CAEEX|nr:hypothetical protein CEXT_221421 [Caerostris extrusa]